MSLTWSYSCPGCGKRVHGPSEERCKAHMERHLRNCNVIGPKLRLFAAMPEAPK